jgi:alpha-galactosidase
LLTLESKWLHIDLQPAPLSWSLQPNGGRPLRIEGATAGADWRSGSGSVMWSGDFTEVQAERSTSTGGAHGPVQWIDLDGITGSGAVGMHLRFGLLQEHPLLILSAEVENRSQETIRFHSFDLLRLGSFRRSVWRRLWAWLGRQPQRYGPGASSSVSVVNGPADWGWYSNGWQSWSFAGAIDDRAPLTGTRLGPLTSPMYINPSSGRPSARARRTSEMFAVLGDRQSRCGILLGQLSERQAFGSLRAAIGPAGKVALRVTSDLDGVVLHPAQTFRTDSAAVQFIDLDDERPLDIYTSAVARENQARVPARVPTGWSSWYYFFDKVSEADVTENLDWLDRHRDRVPMEFVQLDDGFQPQVGDWLQVNDRFPHGHGPLVDKIEARGYQAGLWLAPFIAHPRSSVVLEHPEWLLRSQSGRPVRAGYNWNTFVVALDPTHPDVIDYVQNVVRIAVEEWGYRYLKLDFLYAAALPGAHHDPTLTRAQALRAGLLAIRQAAGEETILAGCGSPLGPAVGLVDTMRIGPDIAPRWRPAYQGIETFFQREPSLPAARNAARNTINRAALHGRWWLNDPDCVLLRQADTHLSASETRLVSTVAALSGGALFISDDLPRLSGERIQWLQRLLPPLPGNPVVPDWFDRPRPHWLRHDLSGPVGRWCLLAAINWSGRQRRFELDLESLGLDSEFSYHAVDWWDERLLPAIKDGDRLDVAGHGVRLLRLSPTREGDRPEWLGDSFHISGGLSVASWLVSSNALKARLEADHKTSGMAWIKIPGRPDGVEIEPGTCSWRQLADHVIELQIDAEKDAELIVHWLPEGQGSA